MQYGQSSILKIGSDASQDLVIKDVRISAEGEIPGASVGHYSARMCLRDLGSSSQCGEAGITLDAFNFGWHEADGSWTISTRGLSSLNVPANSKGLSVEIYFNNRPDWESYKPGIKLTLQSITYIMPDGTEYVKQLGIIAIIN